MRTTGGMLPDVQNLQEDPDCQVAPLDCAMPDDLYERIKQLLITWAERAQAYLRDQLTEN